jgi:hypothetical protein
MTLEFEGGVAAKVWLNGTVVAEYEPALEPTPEAAAAKAKLQAEKKKADAVDEDEVEMFFRRRGEAPEPRKLRLGLRAGDNHLVLKLVGKGSGKAPAGPQMPPELAAAVAMGMVDEDEVEEITSKFGGRGPRGGGLAFSCRLRAEGDDLLDYATMQSLRAPVASVAPTAESNAGAPASVVAAVAMTPTNATTAATTVAATVPAPASAPAAAADEQKPKTPAERRTAAVRRWYRTRIDIAGRVLFDELVRLRREKQKLEAKLPSALVMEELKTPRETHLFVRGD